MFYAFLVLVGLVALGVYATLILHLVPGAAEERLGVLEALPRDLGVWKTDESSPEGAAAQGRGLTRQVRTYHQPSSGWFGGDRLILQVRYRDRTSDEIVAVEPEVIRRRRRVKR